MILFSSFLEVTIMTEERRLLATGMPLEDAISNCHALRRDGTLTDFVEKQERAHRCKCGGSNTCPDCPNRK